MCLIGGASASKHRRGSRASTRHRSSQAKESSFLFRQPLSRSEIVQLALRELEHGFILRVELLGRMFGDRKHLALLLGYRWHNLILPGFANSPEVYRALCYDRRGTKLRDPRNARYQTSRKSCGERPSLSRRIFHKCISSRPSTISSFGSSDQSACKPRSAPSTPHARADGSGPWRAPSRSLR